MKSFNQFKQDMNEGVVALAIPAGVGVLKKIVTSSALKAASAGALTGAGYLASKKISDMSDDEIKNPRRKKRKIPRGEQRLRDRENNVRDNDMIIAKPGEAKKQNKLIDKYIQTRKEEVMAAPTNNVGGGKIAGTVEAGDNPPVKKKKRYIYGGTGSRKMWMTKK